jgi:hypothetical protein
VVRVEIKEQSIFTFKTNLTLKPSEVDGNFKKLINPKKKRVKHLNNSGIKVQSIAEKLLSDKKVFDTEVYSAIKNCEINK